MQQLVFGLAKCRAAEAEGDDSRSGRTQRAHHQHEGVGGTKGLDHQADQDAEKARRHQQRQDGRHQRAGRAVHVAVALVVVHNQFGEV